MASPPDNWSLTEHLLSTQEHLYKSATQHPFLLAGAEGRLPKHVLSRWLANDRLYIHSYIRAAGTLLASIDLPRAVPGSQEAYETQLADWLIESLVAIRKEERFFIDVAERYGLEIKMANPITLASQKPPATQDPKANDSNEKLPGLTAMQSIFSAVGSPPPTSLVQSLFLTAAPPVLPWLEGALTFWGTERCYLDAWSWARCKAEERRASTGEGDEEVGKEDADGGALRREFIPNWSSPAFAEFVDRLGGLIDKAVAGVLDGKEGEERERVKRGLLGRVEGKWRTLLEAEKLFWPDV